MLAIDNLDLQGPAPQAPIARPNAAARSYGQVIRGTEDPRDIEYRVLARVTSLMEAAHDSPSPAAMPEALHENRRVWIAFATDLAGDGNALPQALRAGLISLAKWVMGECDRVLRGETTAKALIDVNRSVMRGLKPDAPTEEG